VELIDSYDDTCRFGPIAENSLDDGTLRQEVLSGPLGPVVAAIEAGNPMPEVPPTAASWSLGDVKALDLAAWLNCPELATRLIDLGAEPEGVAEDDHPVMAAAVGQAWPVVEVLLDAGVDPTAEMEDTSVVEVAAGSLDSAALPMVLERVPRDASLDGPVEAGALLVALQNPIDGPMSQLLARGATPDLVALLMAAEVVTPAGRLELLEPVIGDLTSDSFAIDTYCALDQRDAEVARLYRLDDLERIDAILEPLGVCP
jgi:hypothetical protein